MVLERIVPEKWLEKRAYYAFLLGGFYSIIGIILARLLFASDPALAAVAFTSLLLLPEIYSLFTIEEKEQAKDRKSGMRAVWRDNNDFFRVLLFIFLGILVVYSFAAMILPSLSVNTLFREQLEMRTISATGAAITTAGGSGLFQSLLTNNAIILVAVFFVALLAGDGAIFLITWNASVWGAIFGVTARNAAIVSNSEPLVYFARIVLTVAPHVLLEASAYILAAMAGGMLSRAFLSKGKRSEIARVWNDNLVIIGLAIVALFIGAAVETIVLLNADSYARIISLSLQ